MIKDEEAILITGASRGIGRVVATTLAAKRKNPLILLSRNEDGLNETRDLCLKQHKRESVYIFPCDLTLKDDIESLINSGLTANVAVLFNNAGYFLPKSVLECSAEDYVKQFEVNALTSIRLTDRLLPELRKRNEAKIVFTCSITAVKGQARCGAYSAAKQALNGYIQSLREALYESKIGVTSILLGQTYSSSWDGLDIDPDRLADPEDIGRLLNMICDSSARSCFEEVVIRPQQGDL
ncbi:MAG: SDR family oxidoreductase [Balneolales bacterium]|nr:SDR family oxidoreductase [Balneolales bacterium]